MPVKTAKQTSSSQATPSGLTYTVPEMLTGLATMLSSTKEDPALTDIAADMVLLKRKLRHFAQFTREIMPVADRGYARLAATFGKTYTIPDMLLDLAHMQIAADADPALADIAIDFKLLKGKLQNRRLLALEVMREAEDLFPRFATHQIDPTLSLSLH